MNNFIWDEWLLEFDIPGAAAQGDPAGGQAPMSDPSTSIEGPAQDPNVANTDQMQNMAPDAKTQDPNDVSSDPNAPDMPETKDKPADFEVWKNAYMKGSIKGDPAILLDLLSSVRNADLQPAQKKFVKDNHDIQKLREFENIKRASQEMRRSLKQQLDRNNPATSVVNHLEVVIEKDPLLLNRFVVIAGYGGLKGDLHRKFIAALMGGVQVGAGGDREDVIYNEVDYSIMLSTRYNSQWGDVNLCNWSLREDDPERYLSEPERTRLQEGSPEEREVLRKRIVVESIAQLFENRAFLIQIMDMDGTLQTLGWDLANSLRGAYAEGKLVVKSRHSENSEAMIDDNGMIVPMVDLLIYFVKETGEQDEDGAPAHEEIEFIQKRDGMLFLTAGLPTIREAASSMQGIALKEFPYNGNPSDLEVLTRSVYTTSDLIMRQG